MNKMIQKLTGAALLLVMAGCSSSPASGSGVSGTYTGEAVGQGGADSPVKVTITLENSVITDCQAEGPGETDGIGSKAIDTIPGEIVEANSLDVDSVSGATITSEAIFEAAEKALNEAGLKPADLAKK